MLFFSTVFDCIPATNDGNPMVKWCVPHPGDHCPGIRTVSSTVFSSLRSSRWKQRVRLFQKKTAFGPLFHQNPPKLTQFSEADPNPWPNRVATELEPSISDCRSSFDVRHRPNSWASRVRRRFRLLPEHWTRRRLRCHVVAMLGPNTTVKAVLCATVCHLLENIYTWIFQLCQMSAELG